MQYIWEINTYIWIYSKNINMCVYSSTFFFYISQYLYIQTLISGWWLLYIKAHFYGWFTTVYESTDYKAGELYSKMWNLEFRFDLLRNSSGKNTLGSIFEVQVNWEYPK